MKPFYLFLAWLIAVVALLGTLFSSEILGMPVCHLCWYQRVCIYPLVIILGVATFKGDFQVFKYAIAFPVIGALFAIYQYLEQMIPSFAPINFCGGGPSCSDIHIKLLGFITYPFLSIVACVLIVILLFRAR